MRSDAFPQCIVRADRKADVWRTVFPYDIQFVAAPITKTDRASLLRGNMHVIEAVRRLLWIQFKTILVNLDALRSKGKQANRFMTFASYAPMRNSSTRSANTCPEEQRREIQGLLAEISEELGPVRDLDEWVDLLQSAPVHSVMAGKPGCFRVLTTSPAAA